MLYVRVRIYAKTICGITVLANGGLVYACIQLSSRTNFPMKLFASSSNKHTI